MTMPDALSRMHETEQDVFIKEKGDKIKEKCKKIKRKIEIKMLYKTIKTKQCGNMILEYRSKFQKNQYEGL